MSDISSILKNMRKAGKIQDMSEKGDLGEEAVLKLCLERKERQNCGLLYHSFMYPYQSNRSGVVYTGNIIYKDEDFIEYTDNSINDEIDVLYITPYRIFPIEVKSYGSKRLDIYDYWFNRAGTPVEKSPFAQAEKHARHLYHAINTVIPDGDPKYIKPIVCFVDKCKVHDERSEEQQEYIPVCILNNLIATINRYSIPLDYNLDLSAVADKLNQVKTSIKHVL